MILLIDLPNYVHFYFINKIEEKKRDSVFPMHNLFLIYGHPESIRSQEGEERRRNGNEKRGGGCEDCKATVRMEGDTEREGGGKLGNTWKLLSAYDEAPYSHILKHRYLMNCPNHVGNGVGPVGVGTAAPISASHALQLYTFPACIAPPLT
jgi:hypothetical protein